MSADPVQFGSMASHDETDGDGSDPDSERPKEPRKKKPNRPPMDADERWVQGTWHQLHPNLYDPDVASLASGTSVFFEELGTGIKDELTTGAIFYVGGPAGALAGRVLGKIVRGAKKGFDVVDESGSVVKSFKTVEDATKYADDIYKQHDAGRLYWKTSKEINGKKVYQRDDLIDLNLKDPQGRSNLDRMKEGLAPIGSDGKSIILHHLTQMDDGPLAEVLATFHEEYHRQLHMPHSVPSGINRPAFDKYRKEYWKRRVKDFEKASEVTG